MEWCLVVATPVEVILCALNRGATIHPSNGGGNNGSSPGGLKVSAEDSYYLVPTFFTLPTDQVRILSIVGTESGRIFLGGHDGRLYEMTYQGFPDPESHSPNLEERLQDFYDQGVPLPSVLSDQATEANVATALLASGKRTLMNFLSTASLSLEDGATGPPRKCRKLNRSATPASSWMSAVLPDLILKAGSFLFGGGTVTGGGAITSMQVDEDRQCLYTLGANGWICSFRLADTTSSDHDDSLPLCAVMQTPKTVRLYLEAVARGQMLPPHTSGTAGAISFLGGGAAAVAGVGGMEVARNILKAADPSIKPRSGQTSPEDSIKPVSIHIVPPTESSRITLLAVTAGGLRLYLSSLSSSVLSSGPTAAARGGGGLAGSSGSSHPLAPSTKLTLCHIRAPAGLPGRANDTMLSSTETLGMIQGGVKPGVDCSTGGNLPRVDASLYQQGVFLAAIETRKTRDNDLRPLSRQSQETLGDVIVAACPDSVAREAVQILPSQAKQEKQKVVWSVPGGVAETVSFPMSTAYGIGGSPDMDVVPGGLVLDIALATDHQSALRTLTTSSQTPQDKELELGLTPVYVPPSKIRARESRSLVAHGVQSASGSSTAMISRSASFTPWASPAFVTIFNMILARPNRSSMLEVSTTAPLEYSRSGLRQERNYRVSKRFGYEGFSKTAMDTATYGSKSRSAPSSTSKTSRGSKSARLSSWLLQPATVPLNPISTQHLEQTRKKVSMKVRRKTVLGAELNQKERPTLLAWFGSHQTNTNNRLSGRHLKATTVGGRGRRQR